jgi:hypothetical protein
VSKSSAERSVGVRGRERGFTLALSLFVTGVVIALAAGLMARVLNDMKGAKTTAQVVGLANDADLGLSLAESEIFKDLDVLAAAIWAVATNDVIFGVDNKPNTRACPEPPDKIYNSACLPADEPGKADPLRNLDLIGNARNWPAFGDWGHYVKAASGYGGGYTDATAGDTAAWNPTPPTTVWNGNDYDLTNGWWYVPRDDNADVDYYTFSSNNAGDKDRVFPMAIAGEKPERPKDGQKYGGDNAITVVHHNFWYQQVLPIKADPAADNAIQSDCPNGPKGCSVWPNALAEYGNDDNSLSGTRYVWNTPFYKKIYPLPDGRKVAVYLRLDLRDYFAPAPEILADPTKKKKKGWTQPNALYGNKASENFLKFFLASVPEGRTERIPGTTNFKYRPAEMRTKYILVKTLGAWNRPMTLVNLSEYKLPPPDNTAMPQFDDHQYPAVLQTAGGFLRTGTDMKGQVFRADANRGFNWESMRNTLAIRDPDYAITWTPVSSERFVYLWEQVATRDTLNGNAAATATFLIWARYPRDSINQNADGFTPRIRTANWTFHRIDIDELNATDGAGFKNDNNWDSPCPPAPGDAETFQAQVFPCKDKPGRDATTSFWSSFSAIVDASGGFVISAASGHPSDQGQVDPRYKVRRRWVGPEVDDGKGRVYFTTNVPICGQYWNRRSFRYDATASAGAMR